MQDAPENRSHQVVERLPSGRFAPGVTGNPGGRPQAVRDVAAAARAHTADAISVLAEIMNSPKTPSAARVAASSLLLAYAWGKPTQAIAVSLPAYQSPQTNATLAEAARSVSEMSSKIDGFTVQTIR
jgi:hypothetical protein